MAEARRVSLLWGLISLLVGCADGPPLDELPLRDALRAEPAVVAALPEAGRVRLASRLEAARTSDSGSDPVAVGADPGRLVGALDDARGRRSADALIVGAIADGVGRPVPGGATPADQQPLPALEGPVASDTAALEARALAGDARGPLRGLLAASGATRLERVVGWPVGAVAIGDTVYVNASWLVALAPPDARADGGADGAPGAGAVAGDSGSSATAAVTPVSASSSGTTIYINYGADAGTSTPPPPPSSTPPDVGDACSATADSCDTGTDDSSCDSTDDGSDSSCSGSTDDGSADACSAPPDDGSSCRVAPGRERSRPSTMIWVMAPLGFLIGRRR